MLVAFSSQNYGYIYSYKIGDPSTGNPWIDYIIYNSTVCGPLLGISTEESAEDASEYLPDICLMIR